MRHLASKAFRKFLQLYFRFDKWHISPLSERPYAMDIIKYCNLQNHRESIAEIGCGLGDIIRNVDYIQRHGYDKDTQALKAARLLPRGKRRNGLAFDDFDFPHSALPDKVNVLIMVNWIHHIEEPILRNKIHQYFRENLLKNGQIIIDTVGDPAYRYNHDIRKLSNGLDCTIQRLGEYARQREIWAIIKK
jgi:SAM-dependent methyltransferase